MLFLILNSPTRRIIKNPPQVSNEGNIGYDYKLPCQDETYSPKLTAVCCSSQKENCKQWPSPFSVATNRFKVGPRADAKEDEKEHGQAESSNLL